MSKSAKMEKTLDDLAEATFGRTRSESLEKQICVMCGEEATKFKNALSAKEYGISGMCQKCQDKVFD